MRPAFGRQPGRIALVLALLALAGCFNPFDPRVLRHGGIPEPPPAPNSPGGVLRLLEWCYEHRAITEYRELFTQDYRFVFGQVDPYGEAYQTVPWTREDEIVSTTNLFQGGAANQPAATSITLTLDPNFVVRDDSRYPGQGRVHKTIRTSVYILIVDANQAQTTVTGFAVFSLTRGDVALIPEDLRERGFGPDSTRWYIERQEDETAQPGAHTGSAERVSGWAVPAGSSGTPAVAAATSPLSTSGVTWSWGRLKAQYR